jgi:molecular chaperone DnaK
MATTFTVGIDLGTTNSVACSLMDGQYRFISMGSGNGTVLPSAFLYQNGTKTFGALAKRKSVVYGNHFISSSKTHMGNQEMNWEIDGVTFSPTDIAAEILTYIYEQIKSELEVGIDDQIEAVITVPAYFTSNQIDETKKAGVEAGFVVKRLISEPVAAAIAYGKEITDNHQERLFIFDLGGGTFDVSVLKVSGEYDEKEFITEYVGGDKKLGGDDFDEVIYELLLAKLRTTEGVNLASAEIAGLDEAKYTNIRQKLMHKAEEVKCDLSETNEVNVMLTNLYENKGSIISLNFTITREEFEEASQHLISRIKSEVEKTFSSGKVRKQDISRVILVGGSSQLPFVHKYITEFFNLQPYSNIDLSKIVAMGAANLAFNSSKGIGEVKITDIISHSLGTSVIGGYFSRILHKNDRYPTKNTELYTTVRDFQESITVEVYEGDAEYVEDCEYFGEFELTNIERAREGVPEILITFEFDENRILKVTAQDKKTKSIKSITINKK